MAEKMIKAAVLHKVGDLRVEEVPMPEITNDNDVLVKIGTVGVCGSDVHYYTHGRIGDFVVEAPLILGHESAGVVEEVGSGVTDLKPGDRVAIEPGVPCGMCRYCRDGRYNLCPDVVFLGTPPVHGAYVEYLVHPAEFTYKLADNVTLAEGAMIEPLSVGLQGVKMSGIRAGDTIAILGGGPIGLATLQSARACGAGVSIITDLYDFRLDLAGKLGATHTINAKSDDVEAAIMDLTNGIGADVVFETAGTGRTMAQTVDVVRTGGTIVLIGLGGDDMVPLNLIRLIINEVAIKTVSRYANTYPPGIALASQGKVDLKSMITGEFPLAEVETALRQSIDNPESTIKTMVNVSS